MRSRAAQWDTEEVPFGSEMAWDSTGQEGVYYWAKYFGFTNTAAKSVNSVLGYMQPIPTGAGTGTPAATGTTFVPHPLLCPPLVPPPAAHNELTTASYGGKLRRIERQIHHYGSGLNALVLLSAFRSSPSDTYLLRTGYGGTTGPLSNINQDGFAAASFHSWPDTLKWDGISGDYGPGFLGLALGSGTYVAQDADLGLVAFGGVVASASGGRVSVTTRDAVRRRVFIGPLGVLISVDAGIIREFAFDAGARSVSVTLAQLDGVPKAASAVVWVETTAGTGGFKVTTSGIAQARGGWSVPLSGSSVTVQLGPS
ncbi:LOW QUALITY PROTEIN: glycoside hydrolase family 43 protein [Colletotrichum tofieldiae]|nr:LOW QUALITY PROTEIN: glycoside hydrolase family 43 protein [Colletotrichum tofieldiae]